MMVCPGRRLAVFPNQNRNGTNLPLILKPHGSSNWKPWLQIWRKAFERLGEVDALIVWGYSLPQTDIKAQHFFSLALGTKAVKLCVIDPSGETRKRWRELLPKAHFFPYDSIEKFLRAPPPWWRLRETADGAE